jgi:hypothetical protein
MADNVELNAGSGGATLATDDIAGVHHQKVKVEFGGDDSATQVSSGNPLPVAQTGALTVTANLGATDNALLDAIQVAAEAIDAGKLEDATFTGRVGEVQATPTANTLLGRLKDIDDALGGTLAVSGTVTANLGATDNAVLDSIDAAVNGTLTVSGTVTANLGVTDNAVLDAIQAATEATQTAVETIDNAISGSEMQVDVVAALPAGGNTIGQVGLVPGTSGGLSMFRSIDLDESEEAVKASAGQVYGWFLANLAAGTRYIHFYDATVASVSVGSTTPVLTIPLLEGQAANVAFPQGIAFATAITVAATTTLTGADAPGANEVVANILHA